MNDTTTTSRCALAAGSAPLRAEVKDGLLTITIGTETLAWSTRHENGGRLEGLRVDRRKHKGFAKDVAREMTREDEIGATPLSDFIDKMVQAAADNGSIALLLPSQNNPGHPRRDT